MVARLIFKTGWSAPHFLVRNEGSKKRSLTPRPKARDSRAGRRTQALTHFLHVTCNNIFQVALWDEEHLSWAVWPCWDQECWTMVDHHCFLRPPTKAGIHVIIGSKHTASKSYTYSLKFIWIPVDKCIPGKWLLVWVSTGFCLTNP